MIVRRSNAMGDVLSASCVAVALVDRGMRVEFQTDPRWHGMLRRHPGLRTVAITSPSGYCDIDLDGAYEHHPQRTSKHYVSIYFEKANLRGSVRRPVLVFDEARRNVFQAELSKYPKPWIMVCPRSNSFVNRTIPNETWSALSVQLKGTKFWVGTIPPANHFQDLACCDIETLIDYLSLANLFVTTETGPMHIGAALRVPMVVIKQATDPRLTLINHPNWTVFEPDLSCLNCQQWTCPINANHPPCQNIRVDKLRDHIHRRLGL